MPIAIVTCLATVLTSGCAPADRTTVATAADPNTDLTVAALPAEAVVIGTDTAMASQAAKGDWVAALKAFAAPDATVFTPQPQPAAQWLKEQDGTTPDTAWQPHVVMISCDGTMAATTGAIRWGEQNGYYTTLWARTAGGEWRWIASHGDGLEQPRKAPPYGRVGQIPASCEGRPNRPIAAPAEGEAMRQIASRDQSMLFTWRVRPDGSRSVIAAAWNGEQHVPHFRDEVAAR